MNIAGFFSLLSYKYRNKQLNAVTCGKKKKKEMQERFRKQTFGGRGAYIYWVCDNVENSMRSFLCYNKFSLSWVIKNPIEFLQLVHFYIDTKSKCVGSILSVWTKLPIEVSLRESFTAWQISIRIEIFTDDQYNLSKGVVFLFNIMVVSHVRDPGRRDGICL